MRTRGPAKRGLRWSRTKRRCPFVAAAGAGEAAEYTFGLVQGTKLWSATERRKAAAKAQGVSTERFRKGYQGLLIEQVAEGILATCHDRKMREARVNLERRHPADSRLAVQWVERFEAYYRIWTPRLTTWPLTWKRQCIPAARSQPSIRPGRRTATSPTARNSKHSATAATLYAYAAYQLELHKFMTRHGGLWLLSDHETEQQVADAVYAIGWHNPMNEDDDSWLRRTLADSRHTRRVNTFTTSC